LEDSAETLSAVAAYIDRNAVRAGIVDRPEDYRWCGYAEAHAGHVAAQRTLADVFCTTEEMAWAEAEERYSWLLLRPVTDTAGWQEDRNPAFTRALAMGSQKFILETYARFPEIFTTKRRPAQLFVVDGWDKDGSLCASHRPRETAAIS
jgi:hypothetical protein